MTLVHTSNIFNLFKLQVKGDGGAVCIINKRRALHRLRAEIGVPSPGHGILRPVGGLTPHPPTHCIRSEARGPTRLFPMYPQDPERDMLGAQHHLLYKVQPTFQRRDDLAVAIMLATCPPHSCFLIQGGFLPYPAYHGGDERLSLHSLLKRRTHTGI